MSEYFDREILCELNKIPTPKCPGFMVLTSAKSQPVFTSKTPGEVIIAAGQHSNGKIFVTTHDCYLRWLDDKESEIKKSFMNNVKKWLTGDESVSEIAELSEKTIHKLNYYKLIKWHGSFNADDKAQAILLSYIESGGSVICACTPWGYLQSNPNKRLKDLSMYRFLKDHFGIILTEKSAGLNDVTEVCDNHSKISHFGIAFEKLSQSRNIDKYLPAIKCSVDHIDKDKLNDLKCLLTAYCTENSIKISPSEKKPISDANTKNLVYILNKCLLRAENEKAQGVKNFPGDFKETPVLLQDVEIVLETRFNERLSTGYYLPAGLTLLVDVKTTSIKGWKLLIGCHTDDLTNCQNYKRWPCVTKTKELKPGLNSISSPFGGLVYVLSPNGGGEISLGVSNVVEAPCFDLTRYDAVEEWSRRKYSPGLWAELAGENVIFTTPSTCIHDLNDPTEVMKFWDKVVRSHHDLRGTDPSNFKRERIVNDIQPYAGYMHACYPIVTHLDCCQASYEEHIFDVEKLKQKGCWGLFHELGHNMQRGQWTFDGSTEVTVNIFSLHAMYFVVGHEIKEQKWIKKHAKTFKEFFSQPSYEMWKKHVGVALCTFAQLIKHFGWISMTKFMKEYEEDIESNHNLPKINQDKIDQWVLRYSKIVGRNIKPQFEMFGLPVSNKYDTDLEQYEAWCIESEKDPDVFFS